MAILRHFFEVYQIRNKNKTEGVSVWLTGEACIRVDSQLGRYRTRCRVVFVTSDRETDEGWVYFDAPLEGMPTAMENEK